VFPVNKFQIFVWSLEIMIKVRIDEMTRTEFQDILEDIEAAIIPVASTEQHGPHLPMSHDLASATYVANKAAEKLFPKVIVSPPPTTIGISEHHMHYPGTLTLKAENFINVVLDVIESLNRHGIKKIVVLNGHGGNRGAIKLIGYKAKKEFGVKVAAFSYWDLLSKDVAEEIVVEERENGAKIVPGHAGEFETSMALVIHPELVRNDCIFEWDGKLPKFLEHEVLYFENHRPNGVGRNPSLGNKEKGEILIKNLVDQLVEYLTLFIKP
jgi:creatinine amidohydrolase